MRITYSHQIGCNWCKKAILWSILASVCDMTGMPDSRHPAAVLTIAMGAGVGLRRTIPPAPTPYLSHLSFNAGRGICQKHATLHCSSNRSDQLSSQEAESEETGKYDHVSMDGLTEPVVCRFEDQNSFPIGPMCRPSSHREMKRV